MKSRNVTTCTEVRYVSIILWRRARVISFFNLFLNSTLPIPDTKGISSSLSILANCLEQMSLSDYIPLAQMYGLTATHPLLQAYYCSYESALRSQFTPLFYARHKVGQVMHKVLLLIYIRPSEYSKMVFNLKKGVHLKFLWPESYYGWAEWR